MPALDDAALSRLGVEVRTIFDEVQRRSDGDYHNACAKLHKIHFDASQTFREGVGKHGPTGVLERTGVLLFNEAFLMCVFETLRYGEKEHKVVCERVACFVGTYIQYVDQKAFKDLERRVESGDDFDEDDTRYGQWLTETILNTLLKAFRVKVSKAVAARVLNIILKISQKLLHLQIPIDERRLEALRTTLIRCVSEKDRAVCCAAAGSLAALCLFETEEKEDEDLFTEDEALVLDLLALGKRDIRKQVAQNIHLNRKSLPHFIQRTRDEDSVVRKVVYSKLDDKIVVDGEPGPTHPKMLSVKQLEEIARNGLLDPDLEDHAIDVAVSWVKAYSGGTVPLVEALLTFLKRFSVAYRNSDQLEVVDLMLRKIYPSISKKIAMEANFSTDGYWEENLTPELVIFSRTYLQWRSDERVTGTTMAQPPNTISMAKIIRWHYDRLLEIYKEVDPYAEDDDPRVCDSEFTLKELLKLAATLEYSEHDRISMRPVMISILCARKIPEDLVNPCLDVIWALSMGDEQGFARAMSNGICKVREGADAETEDLWSLSVCVYMLARMRNPMNSGDNVELSDLLNGLVDPVRPSPLWSLRSLTFPRTAPRLLLECKNRIPLEDDPTIRHLLTQTAFDLIHSSCTTMHARDIFALGKGYDGMTRKDVLEFFSERLLKEDDLDIKATLCIGLLKLFYNEQLYTDDEARSNQVMANIFKCHIDPAHKDHPLFARALNAYMGAYSQTTAIGQFMMKDVFVQAFRAACGIEATEQVVSPASVCDMFCHWTDPRVLAKARETDGAGSSEVYESTQLDLALNVVKELLEIDGAFEYSKTDRKVLFQLLPNLHLPEVEKVDERKLVELMLLLKRLQCYRLPGDTVSKNSFGKLLKQFSAQYPAIMDDSKEEAFRTNAEYDSLFELVDRIVPKDTPPPERDMEPRTRGQKRRAKETQEEMDTTPTKRARLEGGADADEMLDDEEQLDANISGPSEEASTASVNTTDDSIFSHDYNQASMASSTTVDLNYDSIFSSNSNESSGVMIPGPSTSKAPPMPSVSSTTTSATSGDDFDDSIFSSDEEDEALVSGILSVSL